ncbi:MAG: HNH endonuclease [Erysipelotrichaceae bacterium]
MKIQLAKKILSIIDKEEIQGLNRSDLLLATHRAVVIDTPYLSKEALGQFFAALDEVHAFKSTKHGLDLSPIATVIARSKRYANSEALAFFELLLSNILDLQPMKLYLHANTQTTLDGMQTLLGKPAFFQLALQSTLFQIHGKSLHFNSILLPDLRRITGEYLHHETIISDTLKAVYTKEVLYFHDAENFRNIENTLIPYYNLSSILDILPHRGIPESRDDTKALQSFYKDTLFYECNHTCALCGIELPLLLIASHIKPFRDCAHVFEAIDHNNGLLLCKNHDYLFDQGWISFDDQGNLLVCQSLQRLAGYQERYVLGSQSSLDPLLLTKSRLLFLTYHRNHIYMDALK